MVLDPKQEKVDVNRMIIYSFVPILSVYALWRIQKFWLISLISVPISFGMQLLMTSAFYVSTPNSPIVPILLFLMVLGLYIAICVMLVRHYAQKYNEKIENVGITVESKPAVISRTSDSDDEDNSDDEDDFELCKDTECHLNKGRGILVGHSIKDHGLNIASEEICSHCYHEEKLHNIDLSQKDVNPNLLNSAGRACIGCKEDKLAELCHSFSSALKGSENKETRLEESKIQVEEAERKLEEKKKRKEESRNKMGREEKLQESKRQVEEAKRKLVETKKRKEESRNNRDTDKQIAKNEEEIRRIEEEIRKLDEED